MYRSKENARTVNGVVTTCLSCKSCANRSRAFNLYTTVSVATSRPAQTTHERSAFENTGGNESRSKELEEMKRHLKEILWKAFSCRQSRDSVRVALWFILCDYWDWKSDQIDHFHQLASNILNILMTAFESSLETWNAMCLMRKLLIVAPAVVHYGHYYIIPAAKRLSALIQKWRRRCGSRYNGMSMARRSGQGGARSTTHRKFTIKNDGGTCGASSHEDRRGRLTFLTSSISRFPKMVFCSRRRWLCLGCRRQGSASAFRPPSLRLYPQPFFRGVMIILGRRDALEKTPRAGKLIYSQSQTKFHCHEVEPGLN
ncbi:hypothetical protein B0H13DRAFT_2399110 [Mycena leptocephala]|nr:hypothetical protein B0H13DRAFT_2399110 [Mycena leptocephala]